MSNSSLARDDLSCLRLTGCSIVADARDCWSNISSALYIRSVSSCRLARLSVSRSAMFSNVRRRSAGVGAWGAAYS